MEAAGNQLLEQGRGGLSRLQRDWGSGSLLSQSTSPRAVGWLVPGEAVMAGPEMLYTASTLPHLGTPLLLKIQAAKLPSTAEGRELAQYCWWLGKLEGKQF